MRIGLASFRCENRNIPFNLGQMERAMASARGRADLLCFGEAFLQGFDALCWDYAADRQLAVSQDSGTMGQLRRLTRQYGMALLFGYIESEGDGLYSSCAVLADGEILHNYRRISRGWKEYDRTDGHYREGSSTGSFRLRGTDLALALCAGGLGGRRPGGVCRPGGPGLPGRPDGQPHRSGSREPWRRLPLSERTGGRPHSLR